MTDSADIGKRLYEMFEAGPFGTAPVPDELVEILAKLEAEQNEDKKKQNG